MDAVISPVMWHLFLLFGHVAASIYQTDVYCPFDIFHNGAVKGREYDATLVNSPRLVTGILGYAVELNPSSGVDQEINFGNLRHTCFGNPDLCNSGFTMSLWIKIFTPRSNVVFIISNGGQTMLSYGFTLFLNNDKIESAVRLKSGIMWATGSAFTASAYGIWTQLGITWSIVTGIKLYRNGEIVSSNADYTSPGADGNTAYNDFVIGGPNNPAASMYRANFIIDDLRFWNKVLNSSELRSMYQEGEALVSAKTFSYETRKLDPFSVYQSPYMITNDCQRIQPEEPYVTSALLEVDTYALDSMAGRSSFLVTVSGGSNAQYVDVGVVSSACRMLQRCTKIPVDPLIMMASMNYNCSCPARDCDILYIDLSTPLNNCPSSYISCLPVSLCSVDVVY